MPAGWGNPKPQPAPKVVSSGSVSKPTVTKWRPKADPAPKVVKEHR